MARSTRTSEQELGPDHSTEYDDDEQIEFEEEHPRPLKSTRPDRRRYGLPLAGAVLVGMLGTVIWLFVNSGHQTPSMHVEPELFRGQDRALETPGNVRGAGLTSQTTRTAPAGVTLAPRNVGSERTGDSRGAASREPESVGSRPVETDPAGESGLGTGELSVLQQRFDRLDTSLQTLQGVVQLVLTEMRSPQPSRQAQGALDAADKMLSLLKKQMATRDQEIVRLHRELAAREQLVNDMKTQAQHSSSRTALAGWEIVGLTARNAALKDPNGQTHVVSIGETIADGVQLKHIDPAGTRITTSVGDIAYRAAAAAHGTR